MGDSRPLRPRDGCIVDTLPLSELLKDFCQTWQESRPLHSAYNRQRRPENVYCMTAISWLAQETGISADVIHRIKRGRGVTEFRYADALLSAIGRTDALDDGSLAIRPNPWATRIAQARCCSMTVRPVFEPWSL